VRRVLSLAVLITVVGLPATAPAAYFDVARLPRPTVSGKQIADSISAFSQKYTARITATPNQVAAGEEILAEAKALGYDASLVPLPVAGAPQGVTNAVVATRRGLTHPEEHLVFTAHYDGMVGTLDAAYDNGSGTTMLRALARAFATVPTNRTLVFAWYNGEEEGALASEVHAKQFAAAKKQVRGVLGFDMVGIGWPVAEPGETSCLCMWHGADDEALGKLLVHVNFTALGFPQGEQLVDMAGPNTRNSDEASWDAQNFPTMRWAGMRAASDYPAYHMPDDNMATIDAVAGGRAYFEQGLSNTLLSAYMTALALDNEMPVASARATGTGPVRLDASASTDPDGRPGKVTWDFGDGKTGEGAVVDHVYKKNGVYTATARVADSLWPMVSASASVPVIVSGAPTKKRPRRAKHKRRH